jgi:Recombination endonuclease VII
LQGGKCGICKCDANDHRNSKPEHVRTTHFVLDHDHATMRPRGLLCWACNLILGKIDDRLEWLKNAGIYLIGPERFDLDE